MIFILKIVYDLFLNLRYKSNSKLSKMSVIKTKELLKALDYGLSTMRKDEVSFWWNYQGRDISICSKNQMKQQMRIWRDLFKKLKIWVKEFNNKTVEHNNKKYYSLVIQPSGDDDCPFIDPLAMSLGLIVSGYVMFFISEKNRDMTYEYVTKCAVDDVD